jgi:hypothetical protein
MPNFHSHLTLDQPNWLPISRQHRQLQVAMRKAGIPEIDRVVHAPRSFFEDDDGNLNILPYIAPFDQLLTDIVS